MEKHINELQHNAESILRKLEEARSQVENEPLTMEYDNGGGQSGVRENPFFPAYEKLLKSYLSVLSQIEAMGGEAQKPKTKTLSIVGQSKWKKASNG